MAVRQPTYLYLRRLLETRSRVTLIHGQHQFMGGFRAEHQKCHLTAMQIMMERGMPPVLGVLFLNYQGKLSPWAHVVNRDRQTGRLVDFSPRTADGQLGFIPMDWAEFDQWYGILGDYHSLPNAPSTHFGDELADRLSAEFLGRLTAEPPRP